MLWRKFRLDWRYAIGELIIVVAGVLVALAIDQWNDERLEQRVADEILQHLLIDLQIDLNNIDYMVRAVQNKEQSLLRLKEIFDNGQRPENSMQFLQDILVGARYGWNQSQPVDTTYQEALSSGKFGLIRNSELRSAISGYYGGFTDLFSRADARETQFPHLSYQLVPRNMDSSDRHVLLSTDQELSSEELERLTDRALASPIEKYLIAETNLARFILHVSADIRQRCEALIGKIETYRATN